MIRPHRSTTFPAALSEASPAWAASPDQAITQAIARWKLDRVGWRGFEALPWVKALHAQVPDLKHIAQTASSHDEHYKSELQALSQSLDGPTLAGVRDYFVGKLALEELSCRQAGAGGGLCDKRSAFLDIFEALKQAQASPAP